MKIVEVNTYTVRPRWGFVEIVTDEGLTGWGEPVLEGHCATVLACVQEMKPYLIGKDPMRIEDFSAVLYRAGFYRGGGVLMSAIAGIDQALWDIKGKLADMPLYQLLGGKAAVEKCHVQPPGGIRHLHLGQVQPLADVAGAGSVHHHGAKTGGDIRLQLFDGNQLRPVLVPSGEMADEIPEGENIQLGKLLCPHLPHALEHCDGVRQFCHGYTSRENLYYTLRAVLNRSAICSEFPLTK